MEKSTAQHVTPKKVIVEKNDKRCQTPKKIISENVEVPNISDDLDKSETTANETLETNKEPNQGGTTGSKPYENHLSESQENSDICLTPVKSDSQSKSNKSNGQEETNKNEAKTPVKLMAQSSSNADQRLEPKVLSEPETEEGMMSEIEQAKLLLVASESYLQALEKTPVKQVNSPSPKRYLRNSPGTPGRHKRVELITLDSPKSKKLKQF